MTLRRRLSVIERRLGPTTGPRVLCPLCHGIGVDDNAAQVRIKLARWLDEPDPDDLPTPTQCHLCNATGMATVAAADRFARDAAAAGRIIRAKLAAYSDLDR